MNVFNAKNLTELRDMLNDATEEQMDRVDTSNLPTFGGTEINNTSAVFSWDETHILVVDNEWTIEERCPVCGEASFHCTHDQE